LFAQTFELHVSEICERVDMDFDEVAEVIGEHDAELVWQCAFEDFLARRFEPDGRGVVEDYLKRRGWKESASHRRRMTALSEAVMSLYQVEKVVPDRSVSVRDLIRGGDAILVSDATVARELEVGDRIGGRILALPDRNVLSAGCLPFGKEVAEGFIKQVKPEMKRVRRQASKVLKENEIDLGGFTISEAADHMFLTQAAPAFSALWLSQRLAKEMAENMPAILEGLSDDVALCRSLFPLRSGAKVTVLRDRLRRFADFRADGPDYWNWVGPIDEGGEPMHDPLQLRLEDGTPILGIVELLATELKFTTMSRNARARGEAVIRGLAGDLLDEPTTSIETLDEGSDGEIQGTLDLRLPAKSGSAPRSLRPADAWPRRGEGSAVATFLSAGGAASRRR
jgi:hypothetical protein